MDEWTGVADPTALGDLRAALARAVDAVGAALETVQPAAARAAGVEAG